MAMADRVDKEPEKKKKRFKSYSSGVESALRFLTSARYEYVCVCVCLHVFMCPAVLARQALALTVML